MTGVIHLTNVELVCVGSHGIGCKEHEPLYASQQHAAQQRDTMFMYHACELLGWTVGDVRAALEAKDVYAQVSHGTHGASALAHAQGILNTIVSLVYDGLCQWLTAAVNAWLVQLIVNCSSSTASPQASFTSLSSINEGDLLFVSTPPPSSSLALASAASVSIAPASSLAQFHANVMNERTRSIFIEAFARCLGLDGSAMAVSTALAAIDAPAAAPAPGSPALSLLACIEQETLTMASVVPQARVASLASKVAAAAASSPSLVLSNGNTSIIVKHYMGDVAYSLADIIASNRMTLAASTQALVAKSSNSIVASCIDAALSQVQPSACKPLDLVRILLLPC